MDPKAHALGADDDVPGVAVSIDSAGQLSTAATNRAGILCLQQCLARSKAC